MTETVIKISGLYKIFGPTPKKVLPLISQGLSKDEILNQTGHTVGLKDINLEIDRGEIFVIMGLSGSGKSTLIRHFNRLIDPTEGQIIVENSDIMEFGVKELQEFRRHKMSMVFQRFGLFPHRKVLENVAYGLEVQNISKEKRHKKAAEWIDTVGLKGYEEQYPAQLSGGQQQRVGLARALCTDAEILLMDEAFSALDPLIRSEMQDQLIELQETLHKTIIFITHDLDEALRLGDRIAILKDGELVQQGTPVEILLEPANDYVEAFVKDVNRARALTVETVMQRPALRITAETISGALAQMKKSSEDYGYHITDEGFQGIVTEKELETAASSDADNTFQPGIYEDVPTISPESAIEDVLTETISSDYSLPVVDEDGNLKGSLEKETVADIFSEKSVDKEDDVETESVDEGREKTPS
jgi:glycine betaine/proline transport system ATP-binding protein